MRQLKISKSITNRSSEALDKYLVEIGREPMVSIDEEIELPRRFAKADARVSVPRRNWLRQTSDSWCLLLSSTSTRVWVLPT